MKQRASRINGEFAVVSNKTEGSEIALTLKEYK
jgi:signal transduction histidine kinase